MKVKVSIVFTRGVNAITDYGRITGSLQALSRTFRGYFIYPEALFIKICIDRQQSGTISQI
jgi:hypothetical protein